MALLWCDGFDHYGTGAGNRPKLLDGVWAELSTTANPAAAQARTGAASLNLGNNNSALARRVFPGGDRATIGFGCGVYLNTLPSAADVIIPAQFRNDANAAQISFVITPTGRIQVKRGAATGVLLGESDPVITAAAWNHFECRVFCDDATGTVEVRVNGVTVLDLSGLDTRGQASGLMAQVAIMTGTSNPGTDSYYDDVFCWDTAGAQNNDFLGPHRVYALFPNGDTGVADWTITGTATGWDALNDVPPDDDTSYITAAAVSDISEFDMTDLPAGVSQVSGIHLTSRVRKTDAGTANVQQSLLSAAAVAAGADRPTTEVYTYWPDIIELDPNTGAPWAAAAVNAMKLRLKKTA